MTDIANLTPEEFKAGIRFVLAAPWTARARVELYFGGESRAYRFAHTPASLALVTAKDADRDLDQ